MSVAPGRPGDSRRLSVARAHAPPQAAAGRIASYDVKQSDPLFRLRRRPVAFQQRGFVSPKIGRRPMPVHVMRTSLTSCRRDSSNSVPPMRGGWSADRPHSFFRSRLRRATPCPGATGTSLGAPPWRFSDADPRSRLPAVGHRSRSDCPRHAVTAWRSGSGPPYVAVRAASAGRHSLLRLSGSSPETPLMSEDGISYTLTPLRSQVLFT